MHFKQSMIVQGLDCIKTGATLDGGFFATLILSLLKRRDALVGKWKFIGTVKKCLPLGVHSEKCSFMSDN